MAGRSIAVVFVALGGCTGVERWPEGRMARAAAPASLLEDWQGAIEIALAAWDYRLGAACALPIRLVEHGGCPVRLVPDAEWAWGEDTIGVEDDCYIEIRGIQPWHRRMPLMHELGHAMGLEHSDDPRSVMHGEIGPAVTPVDVANMRAAIGC